MNFPAADWVEHHARIQPDACALYSMDSGESRSWGELEQRVGRLAHGLAEEYGIGIGDRIATLMNGDVRSFELQFACMRIGAILAPLNFRLAVPELVGLCRDLQPSLMITDPVWEELAGEVVAGAAIPRTLMTATGGGTEFDRLATGSGHVAAGAGLDPSMVTHILYTSGTTGTPKGAMSTRATLMWQALNQVQTARVSEPGTHVFSPAPLFHAGGLNSLSNPALFFGGRVSIASRFDPETVLAFAGDPANGVSHLAFGPVMYQMLADHPAFAEADFSAIRLALIAGGGVAEDLRLAYDAKGVRFSSQYGGTETGPTITGLDPRHLDKLVAGSCGQKVMHVEVRLVDEEGGEVPVGEPGEVWVRGPAITAGYWRRDPLIAFTEDGWFRTGDVARRDEEGFYYIVDRIKDMYKSGGENVSSFEVENVLVRHPAIAEVAVIGVPDPKWGEVGLAVIRPAPGHEVTLELVREACGDELARYKHPRHIELVDHFPRNVTGKVSKADLRERFGGSRSA